MEKAEFLKLAIQSGATTENAMRVAEDFERWATPGDFDRWTTGDGRQPLPEVKKPEPPEIDWSRPQLVRNSGNGEIIKTSGDHDWREFSGEVVDQGSGCFVIGMKGLWEKKYFTFHAEIPANQPTDEGPIAELLPKTTGLTLQEAIKKMAGGAVYWQSDSSKGVKRPGGPEWLVLPSGRISTYEGSVLDVRLTIDDIFANDWEIF